MFCVLVVLHMLVVPLQLMECLQLDTSSSRNVDLMWYAGHMFHYNLNDSLMTSTSCNITSLKVILNLLQTSETKKPMTMFHFHFVVF